MLQQPSARTAVQLRDARECLVRPFRPAVRTVEERVKNQ
jgi:hypothetical protein